MSPSDLEVLRMVVANASVSSERNATLYEQILLVCLRELGPERIDKVIAESKKETAP